MKRCSTSLVILKTQVKTAKRYQFIISRMATFKIQAEESQSVEHRSLGFYSGHDLRVMRFCFASSSVLSRESALDSLSAHTPALSLSQINL